MMMLKDRVQLLARWYHDLNWTLRKRKLIYIPGYICILIVLLCMLYIWSTQTLHVANSYVWLFHVTQDIEPWTVSSKRHITHIWRVMNNTCIWLYFIIAMGLASVLFMWVCAHKIISSRIFLLSSDSDRKWWYQK